MYYTGNAIGSLKIDQHHVLVDGKLDVSHSIVANHSQSEHHFEQNLGVWNDVIAWDYQCCAVSDQFSVARLVENLRSLINKLF